MRKFWSALVLSSLALAGTAGSAQAQITLGQLAPATTSSPYCVNSPFEIIPGPTEGNSYAAPEAGVITSWSTYAAEGAGQELAFKVYRPLSPEGFLVVAKDVRPLTPGVINTFRVDIPVEAGDLIGDNDYSASAAPNACQFETSNPADEVLEEGGDAAPGEAVPSVFGNDGYLPNVTATLLLPPLINSLGTTAGPSGGGTSVTISGLNFAEVKSVSFGSAPATSYLVNSEGQITAVSPAGAAGTVPISVVTVAGTAVSSQDFTYVAPSTSNPTPSTSSPTPTLAPAPISAPARTCTVPKLKGKSLKASKKKIRGADCKVGKVTKKKGAKAGTGKVVGQSKKPGTVLPAGTVVKVTLGKG